MNNNDVPIWEKYTLTIEEAAKYFRIGESKLRKLAEENPVPDWVMMNGNRIQIKRKQFEKMIDTVDARVVSRRIIETNRHGIFTRDMEAIHIFHIPRLFRPVEV